MTCLGVLERGEQGDDNVISVKEGGGIEMSIYSAFHKRECTLPMLDNNNDFISSIIIISSEETMEFLLPVVSLPLFSASFCIICCTSLNFFMMLPKAVCGATLSSMFFLMPFE